MYVPIKGEVAIVTGAGSGIGRAIAQKLARMGASVAVTDMNVNAANETMSLLENPTGEQRHTVYQLNVEHGIKYCPYYKAYAIVTPMPTANNAGQLNVANIDKNVYSNLLAANTIRADVRSLRDGTVDANPSGKATIQTSVATGTQAAAASAEPAAEPAAEAAEPAAEAAPEAKATNTKTGK